MHKITEIHEELAPLAFAEIRRRCLEDAQCSRAIFRGMVYALEGSRVWQVSFDGCEDGATPFTNAWTDADFKRAPAPARIRPPFRVTAANRQRLDKAAFLLGLVMNDLFPSDEPVESILADPKRAHFFNRLADARCAASSCQQQIAKS